MKPIANKQYQDSIELAREHDAGSAYTAVAVELYLAYADKAEVLSLATDAAELAYNTSWEETEQLDHPALTESAGARMACLINFNYLSLLEEAAIEAASLV